MNAPLIVHPPRTDWMELANKLGHDFATRAAQHDAEDRFPTANAAALRAHRIYAAAVPAELGGGGADLAQLSTFLRTLARHCPATALALSMHTHNVAHAAWRWRHLQAPTDKLLRRIATEQCVLISTGGNDWLESGGPATPAEGGYRIKARKPFASGQPAGTLINTSAILQDGPEGPEVLHFMVPVTAEGVRIEETWKTLGMRASGSNDIVLDNVFVPDSGILLRRRPGLWHPFFHLTVLVALPLIYSVYLGAAEAARNLALQAVPDSARRDPLVQSATGAMETSLAIARMALGDMLAASEGKPGEETTNRMTTARQIAGSAAIQTVEQAMELAGGRGFFRKMGLERLFRDIQAARYHPLKTTDQRLVAGRLALGLPIDG